MKSPENPRDILSCEQSFTLAVLRKKLNALEKEELVDLFVQLTRFSMVEEAVANLSSSLDQAFSSSGNPELDESINNYFYQKVEYGKMPGEISHSQTDFIYGQQHSIFGSLFGITQSINNHGFKSFPPGNMCWRRDSSGNSLDDKSIQEENESFLYLQYLDSSQGLSLNPESLQEVKWVRYDETPFFLPEEETGHSKGWKTYSLLLRMGWQTVKE